MKNGFGFRRRDADPTDVVMTPDHIAREIVERFQPKGRCLDPCKGDGAFLKHMPGAEWCEIREGRDFFEWTEPVDWIVSNPPYSISNDFTRHAFTVAREIVFLIPINKLFNSDKFTWNVWQWGGVPTIYILGGGADLGFPIGFAVGAIHFSKGYTGGIDIEFSPRVTKKRS